MDYAIGVAFPLCQEFYRDFKKSPASSEPLERALLALWGQVANALPGVPIRREAFLPYVAARLEGEPLAELTSLEVRDLCLAFACGQRDARALAVVDKEHFSRLAEFIATVGTDSAFVDEVRQKLREKMFIGSAERPPKIADYTGRGPLGGWIRMAAIRTALNLRRDAGAPAPAQLEEKLAAESDPELDLIKRQASGELASAIRESLGSLPADDRTLLKLHYVDGLSIDRMAPMFKLHRSSVARRIAKAREQVLADTCRLLSERLGANSKELKSLLRIARSQLDVSIPRILQS